MLVVKDSMVLIHLAKTTLLETSCAYFGKVDIPTQVFRETVEAGNAKNYLDARIIQNAISKGIINVRGIKNKKLLLRAQDFNIQGGEAEAVALYWQEKADLLATDDDNVRGKKDLLELKLIGTPAILLKLFRDNKIDGKKAKQSAEQLRKIGWFNSEVIDRIIMEVEKHG